MKLTIGNEILGKIENEAIACFPKECRGLLIGDLKTNEVKKMRPLSGGKMEIGNGESVIGVYHSHSKGGSMPTKQDMADFHGYGENKSYLILPVSKGAVKEVKAWESTDGIFKPEGIFISYGNGFDADTDLMGLGRKSTPVEWPADWKPENRYLQKK